MIAGGINWGLVGLFGFNLVEVIFGSMTAVSRFIYFKARRPIRISRRA